MSFNSSHVDSDDADSDNENPSDSGTHDDDDLIVRDGDGSSWEMKKVNTLWTAVTLVFLTVSISVTKHLFLAL